MPRARSARDSGDEALAERLVNRDPRALAEVYDRHGPVAFGFLRGTLRDRHAAEDVLQQVFLEVWQRAPTFDPARGGLSTWIMIIARSRAIDQMRRRIPEATGVEADLVADAAREGIEEVAERWYVAGLLKRLPTEEAAVLKLRFYADLSQAEIAERTGIALGTVKTRMVSGLRRLRKMSEES